MNKDNRTENDVRDRIEMILESYTLEEVLEMNELTEQEALFLLFMEGHICEPEAFLP